MEYMDCLDLVKFANENHWINLSFSMKKNIGILFAWPSKPPTISNGNFVDMLNDPDTLEDSNKSKTMHFGVDKKPSAIASIVLIEDDTSMPTAGNDSHTKNLSHCLSIESTGTVVDEWLAEEFQETQPDPYGVDGDHN